MLRPFLLLLALGTLSTANSSKSSDAQSTDILVPPMVQLGSRLTADEHSVAVVWQAKDIEHEFQLVAKQGSRTLASTISYHVIKLDGLDSHRVYVARIANYKYGQKISYQLVSGGTELGHGEFNAPKDDNQPYSFSVFGDFGQATPEEAEISYQTSLKKPDFVVLTGDLVYSNGRLSEYRTNFFPQFLSEVSSPKDGSNLFGNSLIVGVPGNHDILNRNLAKSSDLLAYFYYWYEPLNGPLTEVGAPNSPTLSGPAERQAAILSAAGPNYPRMANFSFDYGNAHWTCIDANRYVDWTDPKLRDWIRKDLESAKNKTWRFVALHQPPFHSSTSHADEKQIRPLAEIFEEEKVDVVFCGHVHNYQRSYPIQVGPKKGASKQELNLNDWPVDKSYDGITNTHPKGIIYLVDGAGGAELYQPEIEMDKSKWLPFQQVYSGDWSSSYVTITGKTFKLVQTNKDGQVVDHFTITK